MSADADTEGGDEVKGDSDAEGGEVKGSGDGGGASPEAPRPHRESAELREGSAEARARQVAVVGSGGCEMGSAPWGLAEEVGRRLAEAGATVVCGGLGGVMEATSRGAAEAGGTVVGILPATSVDDANPHCTHVVATGIGHGRNLAVVSSGEVVIAVGGEWGTLSEIGFARAIGRTVVALRSWTLKGEGAMESAPGIVLASTPEEAVSAALEALR